MPGDTLDGLGNQAQAGPQAAVPATSETETTPQAVTDPASGTEARLRHDGPTGGSFVKSFWPWMHIAGSPHRHVTVDPKSQLKSE